MVEDWNGVVRRFSYHYSDKVRRFRSRAQQSLEKEIYLKHASYFKRLKLDIQLFHMEATITDIMFFTEDVRKGFLLFLAVPASLVAQYYIIMELFYRYFQYDVGRVKRKKIFPLNLPEGEDITYWPLWRVFVEFYLVSYDFIILFTLTSIIVYWITIATASTRYLWSSDPDTQEKNADKVDFMHMAAQTSWYAHGDAAYIYEFRRIELFLRQEVFLFLLSLDVHAFLGTKAPEVIEKEAALLIENLESYLGQVENMILQIREDDARFLKNPSIGQLRKSLKVKALYKHIYDFETCEDIAKVYEALFINYLLDHEQGIVSYFEFEHICQAPMPKKKLGKDHPYAGHAEKFAKRQLEIRIEKNLPLRSISWRKNKWVLKDLKSKNVEDFVKKIMDKDELDAIPPGADEDHYIEYLLERAHIKMDRATKNSEEAKAILRKKFKSLTIWNSIVLNAEAGSFEYFLYSWKIRLKAWYKRLQRWYKYIREFLRTFFHGKK